MSSPNNRADKFDGEHRDSRAKRILSKKMNELYGDDSPNGYDPRHQVQALRQRTPLKPIDGNNKNPQPKRRKLLPLEEPQ